MSFIRFLDLTISDDVPGSKTVWNFRKKLINLGIIEGLFSVFLEILKKMGLVINKGRIIDASFVEVPRQRNKKEDNEYINNGEIPENFKENPKKLSQKDTDALDEEKTILTILVTKTISRWIPRVKSSLNT